MSDPSLAVQIALVARLKALATEAGARVYDEPPLPSAALVRPYITIGDGQTVPVDESCGAPSEVYVQIDVWSDGPGHPQVKRIAGAICDALDDQDLAVAGHFTRDIKVRSTSYSRDPDGVTRRARIDLLVVTQPA